MPLNFSAAHSSRITKKSQNKIPPLRRSASTPFANFNQRKPIKRSLTRPEAAEDEDDDFLEDRLDEVGIVKSLATDLSLRDVAQIVQYISSHMFEAIPAGGGFNSTRIADILNFRKSLPSTVTVAHVHALIDSPTKTERDIAELTKAGTIRRIIVPGRGTGSSNVGDGLILLKNIKDLVSQANGLDRSTAAKFLDYLIANPMAQSISRKFFSSSEVINLMQSGFLTSSSHLTYSENVHAPLASTTSATITSISSVSRAASGSVAAVGGDQAIHDAGGRRGARDTTSRLVSHSEQVRASPPQLFQSDGEDLRLSLPNTGPYLKLVTAARFHFISLIAKSKFREIPLYLLREKWDGCASADDPAAKAKKYRGEYTGTLPSRTRKWKQFYGLSFDWVVAECLGAGLVELFETGSVGRAARVA